MTESEPWNDERDEQNGGSIFAALGAAAVLLAILWGTIAYVTVGVTTAFVFGGLLLTIAIICAVADTEAGS